MSSGNSAASSAALFGSILGLDAHAVGVIVSVGGLASVVLTAMARPLLFATLDEGVAAARTQVVYVAVALLLSLAMTLFYIVRMIRGLTDPLQRAVGAASAIAQGNLTIRVTETPQVSQPQPFSQGGQTQVVPRSDIQVDEDMGKQLVVLNDGVSLQDLVNGLNSLGVGPRDMISILQAIKAAGALQADIEIIG